MKIYEFKAIVLMFLMILIVCFLSSCSFKTGTSYFDDASHFSFPNSNVTNIGRASVTLKGSEAEFQSGKLLRKALRQAIDSKNGDIMVDYSCKNVVKDTTLCILPISWKTYYVTVDGTVAKMDIGRQFLK